MRGMVGAALAAVVATAPAAAAPMPDAAPAQCVLEPGVYGITNSSGDLVGILIVYPDCRMEVFKKVEPI